MSHLDAIEHITKAREEEIEKELSTIDSWFVNEFHKRIVKDVVAQRDALLSQHLGTLERLSRGMVEIQRLRSDNVELEKAARRARWLENIQLTTTEKAVDRAWEANHSAAPHSWGPR